MQNRDVSINIKSTQFAANMQDTVELFTCGSLLQKRKNGGSDYTLSYEESGATGYDGNRVSLDITGDNMVVMRRSGTAATSLVIEKGKKHHCHYGTPHGDFMVGISADDVRCTMNDDGGDLYMKYTIDINSTLMSVNEMFIDFTNIPKEREIKT
jgi:uncharacterized beta-barrel protein YwiB (DUF1934 family)